MRSVILMGALAAASVAQAAGPQEKADELARQGIELRRQGDDSRSLPLFQEAHRISPTPRSAVQLGTAEFALSRWTDAEEHITEGLRSPNDPWIRKNRAAIDEALRTVKTHIATVEVTGEPVGAQVLINGKKVGVLPLPGSIRVNGGSVDVELNAAGYRRGFRTVSVPAGEYQTVVIRLEKADEPPPPPPPPPPPSAAPWQRWAAIGAFAGGAVAAGVGTYGVIRFNDRIDTFNAKCDESTTGGTALNRATHQPDATCAQWQSEYKSARTLAIVGYSVAGALAATGVILLVTAPDARPTEQKVSWACAPLIGRLGATCRMRF